MRPCHTPGMANTQGGICGGEPDDLVIPGFPAFTFVTLGSTTINISARDVAIALGGPVTVSATNSANDALTFAFYDVTARSSGEGVLSLSWLGDLTSDSPGAFAGPSVASMSDAFTQSSANSLIDVSFSVDIPLIQPFPPKSITTRENTATPEPASLSVLAVGALGL